MIRSVRFLTPEVALVDVDYRQIGSLGLMLRVPVLLVLRKESEGWRIAAFRPYIGDRPLPFVRPRPVGKSQPAQFDIECQPWCGSPFPQSSYLT